MWLISVTNLEYDTDVRGDPPLCGRSVMIGRPTAGDRVGAGHHQEPLPELGVAVVLAEAPNPPARRVAPAGGLRRRNDSPDQGCHDPSGGSQARNDLADIVEQRRRQDGADGFGTELGCHHLGDAHGMATVWVGHLLPKFSLGVGQFAQRPLLVAVRGCSRSDRTDETPCQMNERSHGAKQP